MRDRRPPDPSPGTSLLRHWTVQQEQPGTVRMTGCMSTEDVEDRYAALSDGNRAALPIREGEMEAARQVEVLLLGALRRHCGAGEKALYEETCDECLRVHIALHCLRLLCAHRGQAETRPGTPSSRVWAELVDRYRTNLLSSEVVLGRRQREWEHGKTTEADAFRPDLPAVRLRLLAGEPEPEQGAIGALPPGGGG